MLVAKQPNRMDVCMHMDEDCLDASRSLGLVMWEACQDKVFMLESGPVLREKTKKHGELSEGKLRGVKHAVLVRVWCCVW